jgi:hypothetical protein
LAPALELLDNVLGLGFRSGVRLGVRAGIHLDQDVPRACLVGHLVLRLVIGEVLLDLLLAGLRHAAGQLVGRKRKVADLALFRNPRGVARGVLLEECFEVGVGRIDGLAHVVRREDRVVELDLDVVLAIRVGDFLVADRNSGGDERLQAVHDDVVTDIVFKILHREIEARGDHAGVLLFANELAAGEENLAGLAGLQVLAHIVFSGVNAQPVGLNQQNLLLHQLLADALLKQVQDHGVVGVALLGQLLARQLLHALLRNRLAPAHKAAIPVGVNHGIRVIGRCAHTGEAWNQVHHHAHRDDADDDHEDRLGNAIIFLLQEANHEWT